MLSLGGPPAGDLQFLAGGRQLGRDRRGVRRNHPGLPERAGQVGVAGVVGRGLPVQVGEPAVQLGLPAGDFGVEEPGPLGLVLLVRELPVGRDLLLADGDLGQCR